MIVTRWTGCHVLALREAHRMRVADFARRLGVVHGSVTAWELYARKPGWESQQILDTLLRLADHEVRTRFFGLLLEHVDDGGDHFEDDEPA
ncbi:helix-turn-helix domain-containing protein [Rhizomonospora bruguierae]|uniref:hypothetical protein n=1 Tax=Rhizomonospora bruguierae TaxID=1581705 RepID=UPI001BCC5E6C|nr:hypothetical protein [Micromonospora sp. NBRC 107566]